MRSSALLKSATASSLARARAARGRQAAATLPTSVLSGAFPASQGLDPYVVPPEGTEPQKTILTELTEDGRTHREAHREPAKTAAVGTCPTAAV